MREQLQTSARAFWSIAPGCGEIRTEPLAGVEAGTARVDTRYSAISRGSESLVFGGHVPRSEYRRMRAPYQRGDFPYPVCYGYACVGEVVEGSPDWMGQSVFCLHPHQDRFVVPTDALIPLPDDVPQARAVLAANLETALNASWDGAAGPGDRIAVVGGGVVGLLIGALNASLPGSRVVLVDTEPGRRDVAEALGMQFCAPDAAPTDCDLVFHASGSPGGLATALACAGQEASVVEVSWYGDRSVSVPLGEAFHASRLTLKSSQVGRIPPIRAPRWTPRRRLTTAVSMLSDPRFDVLFSGESRFDELPRIMPGIAGGAGPVLCHRIRY